MRLVVYIDLGSLQVVVSTPDKRCIINYCAECVLLIYFYLILRGTAEKKMQSEIDTTYAALEE